MQDIYDDESDFKLGAEAADAIPQNGSETEIDDFTDFPHNDLQPSPETEIAVNDEATSQSKGGGNDEGNNSVPFVYPRPAMNRDLTRSNRKPNIPSSAANPPAKPVIPPAYGLTRPGSFPVGQTAPVAPKPLIAGTQTKKLPPKPLPRKLPPKWTPAPNGGQTTAASVPLVPHPPATVKPTFVSKAPPKPQPKPTLESGSDAPNRGENGTPTGQPPSNPGQEGTEQVKEDAQNERMESVAIYGLLTKREGVRVYLEKVESDEPDVVVYVYAKQVYRAKVRDVIQASKVYSELTFAPLLNLPMLSDWLRACVDVNRKAIRLHQLVGIVQYGASLVRSSDGLVAIHHLDLNTKNNQASNLRVLDTFVHQALHDYLDRLSPRERAAYIDSLATSTDGLGDLPLNLHAEVVASIGRHPCVIATQETQPDDLKEHVEVPKEVTLSPDNELVTLARGTRRTWTLEEIYQVAQGGNPPGENDLATVRNKRKFLTPLAKQLGALIVEYLLSRGYEALTPRALRELFDRAKLVFHSEGGELYLYSAARGVYELVTKQFEKAVIEIAERYNTEVIDLRNVTAVWEVKDAANLSKALPKEVSAQRLVASCKEVLFRLWQHDGRRINGDPMVLNLKNGLLDLKSLTLKSHSPESLSSLQVPYEYDPAANCPRFLEYLNQAVPDPAFQLLLQEWMGYLIIPTTKMEVALLLLGPSGTGKSTFITIIKGLVGEGNCSAIPLEDLGEKFRTANLRDKLVNLVTEVDSTKILQDARFKSFVSGDPITGERKFEQPGMFEPYARFIIAANEPPRVRDMSDAVYRRLHVVKFDVKFMIPDADSGETFHDPDLKDKLQLELPGILNWTLTGLKALRERGRFAPPAKMLAIVNELRQEQNNVLMFAHEACVLGEGMEASVKEAYGAYRAWCKDHGEKAVASNVFGRVLGAVPGVERHRTSTKGRHFLGIRPAS